MSRIAGILAGVVVVLLVVVELAAVPVAERALGQALGRCLPYETISVAHVGRPLVPGLILGRVRDVEVEVTGLEVRGLRVERTRLRLPRAYAPYAPFAPDPPEAVLEVVLVDDDVEAALAETLPFGLEPVVRFGPGRLRVGVPPVEVEAGVRVEDGVLLITPSGLPPSWWARLGLEGGVELPEDLRVDTVELTPGELTAQVRVDVVAGVDGSGACEGPLAEALVVPAPVAVP